MIMLLFVTVCRSLHPSVTGHRRQLVLNEVEGNNDGDGGDNPGDGKLERKIFFFFPLSEDASLF